MFMTTIMNGYLANCSWYKKRKFQNTLILEIFACMAGSKSYKKQRHRPTATDMQRVFSKVDIATLSG